MHLGRLKETVLSLEAPEDGLLDAPDCIAELEFTYSAFRFRYAWGTVYEISFSNHADAADRSACWALLPPNHVILESVESDTLGVGFNGVCSEVTHRVLASWTFEN